MRWPKYWSFSFSIIPSKGHPGPICFRMDWLDLLAVQGTLKSLLQHHSWRASILQCSAFFTVQLSHPYPTTGKTIALTRQTFVGKVMSLLLNMLSRLVLTFLPRSKHLLISWVLKNCESLPVFILCYWPWWMERLLSLWTGMAPSFLNSQYWFCYLVVWAWLCCSTYSASLPPFSHL